MKEFEKLKYEIDLISKGEHNQEFTGVYQRLTELQQTLQLQQTGVMQRNCNSFGCVDPDNSGQCIYCGKILDND